MQPRVFHSALHGEGGPCCFRRDASEAPYALPLLGMPAGVFPDPVTREWSSAPSSHQRRGVRIDQQPPRRHTLPILKTSTSARQPRGRGRWSRLCYGALDRTAPGSHEEVGCCVLGGPRSEKSRILDELIELTGWRRDYAQRALRDAGTLNVPARRQPVLKYTTPVIACLVTFCWQATRTGALDHWGAAPLKGTNLPTFGAREQGFPAGSW